MNPLSRLAPGLLTIEIVTLGFPIYAMFQNKKAARETSDALASFDQKHLQSFDEGTTLADSSTPSLKTKRSTKASSSLKKGKMYPMESLDASLYGNHDGLQVYASCMELNGENIIFLTKVITFSQKCQTTFQSACASTSDFRTARASMFRHALGIFVSLVHNNTASYPINIESNIYTHLDRIFGPATALVASVKHPRSPSIVSSSKITPWDDGPADSNNNQDGYFGSSYPMQSMKSPVNESREQIVPQPDAGEKSELELNAEALDGVDVPADFDDRVFDAAFKSVRFMVWSETWQRYMSWRRNSGAVED